MTTYSAQELSCILSRPGYAIADGSQMPSLTVKNGQGEVLQSNSIGYTVCARKAPYGPSVGF